MVTTAMSLGSISRERMVCSASTRCEATTMGSTATWGMAPWPPLPRMVMMAVSELEYITPGRKPNCPAG